MTRRGGLKTHRALFGLSLVTYSVVQPRPVAPHRARGFRGMTIRQSLEAHAATCRAAHAADKPRPSLPAALHDLTGADLTEANLTEADLYRADLTGAFGVDDVLLRAFRGER